MREINPRQISDAVSQMVRKANYTIGADMLGAFKDKLQTEASPRGKQVLSLLIENAEIADSEKVPYCQDTGYAVFFVELGREVRLTGDLEAAINDGVRDGYTGGFLRFSIVKDPLFDRSNSGDNTPAFITTRVVEGDQLKISFGAKGGGSENKSRVMMLKPSDGVEGVKNFVVETVLKAGPDACPPLSPGVGIGGDFELCAVMAKQAAILPVGFRNPDPRYAKLELELIDLCNRLGVGPAGFGGNTTVLDLHIKTMGTHIASLPVAVNIQCHAARHGEIVL